MLRAFWGTMIFVKHATKTDTWEDWMHEYKHGAFYIFPPDSIIGSIDTLRAKFDPKSHSICQTHISLSEPLPALMTDSDVAELQQLLSTIPTFTITYGPLRSFPPHPGVVYRIEPEETIKSLRDTIQSPKWFDGMKESRKFAPHMTIAEFITIERTEELLNELSGKVPQGTFLCDSVELAIPDNDFRFVRSQKFKLHV